MKKYLFRNDYSFGAHPKVLEAVCAVNLEGNHGYGDDGYTARAKERIREVCGCPDAMVEFLIGGTKNGAMFGEALVITRPELTDGFFRMKKRMGAVMEKGWIQGVMFQALFTDDLYFHMARHANEMAARLQDGLRAKGWTLWVDSPTNQVFAVVDNALKPQLDAVCDYEDWCPYDGSHTVVRFVTCFQTSQEDVDGLLAALPDLH